VVSAVDLLRCGVECGDSYHLLDDDEHEGEGLLPAIEELGNKQHNRTM
jgi:hypothetical protein